MIAAVSDHTRAFWYLARGTGVVSLLLLTASLVLGITEVSRWSTTRFPRFVTATLHKQISLLAVVFLGVHILSVVIDGYAPIRLVDAVIPFQAGYRPLWLGLGAVAFDLIIALIVTSLLRRHIGYRAWRAVHWAAYASFPVALLHGFGTGSDTRSPWMFWVNMACLAAFAGAIAWRVGFSSITRVPVSRSARPTEV